MIATTEQNVIRYTVMCIHEFANRFALDYVAAFRYLKANGGLQFILDQYEAEHTLGLEDAIEDMQHICKQNGGLL